MHEDNQFGRCGWTLLWSLVLTLLCGIHSRSALGITSGSGWNSLQNPTTSPTSLPPTVSFTRLNGQFSSGPSIRLFSKNVELGM
uniref:Uncharacterized protein n=1 Tax=Quercus lobata TaxID=97700 RepID=A0A7N2MBS4_QUELO